MTEKRFNLLDEQWIRVIDENGRLAEVSLLTLFARAHGYKRLANETETIDIVILRLLLAILHAVFSAVDTEYGDVGLTNDNAIARWKSLWALGSIPDGPVAEYLEYHRDRFWLFHPETPFYQVADLATRRCTEYRAPKLIGDIAQSENKVRLFSGRTDNARLSYPEAARWLLHLNTFDDTSAKPSVRGGKMESPGAGWLGKLGLIFSEGQNLFQTLLLNLVLLNHDGEVCKEETPVWEVPVRTGERVRIAQPKSLAELYTLQSRRLLLVRDGDAVTGYKLLGGDFFEKEDAFIEPMTLWRYDKKSGTFTPKRHDPARQIWRDFEALIASGDGVGISDKNDNNMAPGIVRWHERLVHGTAIGDMPLRFSTPSVKYGGKDFFADDMFSDSISFNARLLGDLGGSWRTRIAANLKITDEAAQCFGRFASDLALAEGADSEKGNIARLRGSAREEAYEALDIPFRKWLAGIGGNENADTVMIEWRKTVKRILHGLVDERLEAASSAAFVGRNGYTASRAELRFGAGLNTILKLSENGKEGQ